MKELVYKKSNTLFGHNKEVFQFSDMYSKSTLPNVFLCVGMPGIGKSTFAHLAAVSILSNTLKINEKTSGEHTDNNSLEFVQVMENVHPDFLKISLEENKSSIPITEVRKISNFLTTKPIHSNNKVIIIENAESLNINASNALLKILEEPSETTYIFLITRNLGKIIPTIRSRCFKLYFSTLSFTLWSQILTYKGFADSLSSELYAISNASIKTAIQIIESNMMGKLLQLYSGEYDLVILQELTEFASNSQNNWEIIEGIVMMKLEEELIKNRDSEVYYNLTFRIEEIVYLLTQTRILNLNKKNVLLSILAK